MPLIPWRPFDPDRFFEDEDWLLPVFTRSRAMMPETDMYETDKEVVAKVSVPGYEPEKVEVSVKDGILRVKGSMEDKKEEKERGYWWKEIRQGSFERMMRLPVAVKEDAVEATYEKGVLKIVMPKAEVKPGTKVKIQVKGK